MISTLFFSSHYNNKAIFLFIIIFLLILPCFSQEQESRENILVPMVLSGEYQGEILIMVEGGEYFISFQEFLKYVESKLNPEGLESLQDQGETREMIPIININSCGLEVNFREDFLDLQVEIPPEMRKKKSISLRGELPEYPGERISPVPLSGWINNKLLMRYLYEEGNYHLENDFGAGVNFKSWVLDTELTLSTDEPPFSLNYARVIKDIPFLTSRLEIGDLSYSIKGSDGIRFITGLSLVRSFDITPEKNRFPVGESTIFLEKDSLVEVEVNGQIVNEYELEAGFYHLENFGLSEGVNKVNVFVTDEDGKRVDNLLLPLSAQLLKEKEIDFGMAVGFPNRDISLPVIASYQRAGVTDYLTVELTEIVTLSTKQFYVELNGTGATIVGNLNLKAAFTSIPEESANFSLLGQYRYSNLLNPQWGSFGASSTYDLVVQDVDEEKTGDYLFSVSAFYSKSLSGGFSLTPNITYSSEVDRGRSIRANTFLRKGLGGGSALAFDLSYKWSEEGGSSMEGTLSFSTVFPEQRQSLMIQQNLSERKLYMNWNMFPGESYGLDLNASTQIPFDTFERSSYSFGAGYNLPIGNIDFNHRMVTIFDSPEEMMNTSQLTVNNGFVFTGNQIAFTTPVRGSFLVIAAEGMLKNAGVRINPAGDDQRAVAGKYNAVITGLSPYKPSPFLIEAGLLPPGVEIQGAQYVFTPGFRSGGLISAQVEERVYIGGRLLDNEREPYKYAFGQVYPSVFHGKDDRPVELIEFFTDEDGFFEIYNLTPGDWDFELLNFNTGRINFNIPEGVFGYYEAGELIEVKDE